MRQRGIVIAVLEQVTEHQQNEHTRYRVGDLILDTGTHTVARDGQPLDLPHLSYDLLLALVRAAPNLLSHDELMDQVWGDVVVSPETLTQRVKLVRDALGDDSHDPRYIGLVRGEGYRLIATVSTLTTPEARPLWDRPVFRVGTGLLCLVVLVVVIDRYVLKRDDTSASATADQNSIAVLPFVDMSAKQDQEYFADGMSEELLNLLTQVQPLKVTARTSSFSFKGQNVDIASVADKLNVRHVLEGSVRRSGNTVRITAQLVDVRDNAHLWSQTYDREFDDIFAIQDEIAAAVVKELKVKLLQEQPRATRTDPRAYTLFLQARFLTNRGNPEAYAAAIGLLRQASDLAPAYAPAWAELARAYWFQVYFGLPSPQERETLVNKAHNSYEMALASNPEYSLVYSRLGTVAGYRADFAAAVSYLERALALGPNDIDNIGNAGLLLVSLGRLDEAIAVSQYEVKRDPLNPLSYSNLCRAYFFAERLDDAIASCRMAQTLSPEHYSRYWLLPGALLHKGDAEAALAVFGPDSPREIVGFVVALYELGRREEFEAAFKDLREHGTALHVAEVYTWIDNPDAAFAWLEKDLLNPSTNRIYHVLPWFKKLHDDPRWQPFLERAGVSEKQRAGIEFEVTLPE